jgi:hypothetical protein
MLWNQENFAWNCNQERPDGTVVFVELFTIGIPYVNIMTRMLLSLKFFPRAIMMYDRNYKGI